jgi:ABC-type transport system involved in multi-copper enzyme maturation permease subunit
VSETAPTKRGIRPVRAFHLLAAEAFQDALRSRLGLAVAGCALLALVFVDRCTSLEGSFTLNGESVDPAMTRAMGPILFGWISLFLLAASGLVASDGLARPVADGSIALWLARPVSRTVYALARLSGTLALAISAGGGALVAAAFLLHARRGFALEPALFAGLVYAASAAIVSALAMTLSLYVPRVVTLFAVMLWILLVVVANVAHMFGASFSGWFAALEHWGPPLGTALLYAMSGWVSVPLDTHDVALVMLRLAVWIGLSAALLVLSVRRLELR